jgi:membrane fusion protein, adhesin transport system
MMESDVYETLVKAQRAGSSRWVLRTIVVGLAVLLAWSGVAKIDQVTRAPGQVIAAARTQVIQAPDGGVIKAIFVREGESVRKGQLLASLESARAQAAVDDTAAKVGALRITLARLEAEVYETPLKFDQELQQYKDYVRNQQALYQKRRKAIDEDVSSLQKMLGLAQQELDLNSALEATGDVSQTDILRLKRTVADIGAQIANKRNKYFQDSQAEMTKAQEELNTQLEALRDRSQMLDHTDLAAPTDGLVKNIFFTTVGGVLRAGETMMELVPTASDLVVEAKVSTADIAYVKIGQTAKVKLDAYDYSIFGAMNGEVSYISPDTLQEDTAEGKKPYYRTLVLIREAEFKSSNTENIEIRPGMTATVDIKANERTVFSYLTKPITKTFSQSLGER